MQPGVNAPSVNRVTHKGRALVRSNTEQGVVELVGQLAADEVASVVELVSWRARIIAHSTSKHIIIKNEHFGLSLSTSTHTLSNGK